MGDLLQYVETFLSSHRRFDEYGVLHVREVDVQDFARAFNLDVRVFDSEVLAKIREYNAFIYEEK